MHYDMPAEVVNLDVFTGMTTRETCGHLTELYDSLPQATRYWSNSSRSSSPQLYVILGSILGLLIMYWMPK